MKETANSGVEMRDYITIEKARINVGAVAALVITGWLVVRAIALTAPLGDVAP